MNTMAGVGAMSERITVERPGWPSLAVTLEEASGGLVVITAAVAHLWETGDYIDVSGVGVVQVTVTGEMAATFEGEFDQSSATATFVKDAQGSVRDSWVLVAEMAAAVQPLSAQERLAQPPALMTTRFTRFRVHNISGLAEQQRVRWTPNYPEDSPEQVLQIQGVLQPDSGDRRFLILECVGP